MCADCRARFAPACLRCRRCALEWHGRSPISEGDRVCAACLADPPPFEQARAAVSYGHPWDRLIAAFKFRAALDLAPAFARLMREALHDDDATAQILLLPIPLSRQRLRERGFNQAWELARRLAGALGCACDSRLLLRVKDSPHQLAFPPTERAANVRGAFAIEPQRRAELAGRDVVLIDDVMTTGATAAEAARTLLRVGAARVSIWVIARTPRAADE